MATMLDKKRIEEAMCNAKTHPVSCFWVGGIQITYAKPMERYCAQFDCDLTIIFDYVDYSSNSIYFYRNGDETPIAHITHTGLHL